MSDIIITDSEKSWKSDAADADAYRQAIYPDGNIEKDIEAAIQRGKSVFPDGFYIKFLNGKQRGNKDIHHNDYYLTIPVKMVCRYCPLPHPHQLVLSYFDDNLKVEWSLPSISAVDYFYRYRKTARNKKMVQYALDYYSGRLTTYALRNSGRLDDDERERCSILVE